MTFLRGLFHYLSTGANWTGSFGIPHRLLEHLHYIGLALVIAAALAIPLGLLIGHTGRGAFLAINLGNAARALPTLGLLTIVVLLIGIGLTPVLVALVVLAVPPLLTSTYAGIQAVDPMVTDAARCMGMTEWRILRRVEVPLALPLIMAGLRSAVLQVVATATIAAYVALGGLGRLLIDGLANQDYNEVAAGAVLVAALAIILDLVLLGVQRMIVSPGISGRLSTAASSAASADAPASSVSAPSSARSDRSQEGLA
ncbi:MAG TPA: ABC transporter permease subunit [Mycobacteriales bacterium]|nr:ABC transporter permease subunit [Mycobacteriales bacterium]